MPNDLLTIKDLKIEGMTGDAWLPIIRGVDFSLKRGEVIGLIGESGAGKSTLGLAAMGYTNDGCRISDGSIEFDGIDLRSIDSTQSRKLRGKRIAYVAQSAAASFNPAHKLIDQYSEGPVVHKVMSRTEANAEAITLFEKLQLPNPHTIGFRYPHQVSGGQLQRAMTAMAMACKPDLIIFDEPTTALDVTTQIEVLAAIRNIVQEFNTAAIYITHDLAVVAQMADRIKILLKGEQVEEASTAEMMSAPKENYTKSLWAVRSFQTPTKLALKGDETPLVQVKGITASYGKTRVLHDVDVSMHKGRTVAIVGESGSGKSTIARVIAGLLPADQGKILLSGTPVHGAHKRRSKEQKRQIQMIYQMADTALNPKQTIGDIIGRPAAYFLNLRGKTLQSRIRDLLFQIELEPSEFIDRYPEELSGGQKQRVGIARALAAEPEFIVCDEVTSALDQLVAEGILRLLHKLQKEMDLTYMFITHDIDTVRAIADDVVVMQRGVVVEDGLKQKIFQPPHAPYTELLLSSVPQMDPDWLTSIIKGRK